jgi:hypothetical protein
MLMSMVVSAYAASFLGSHVKFGYRCRIPAMSSDGDGPRTVQQLRAALKQRGLRVSGRKAELEARLAAWAPNEQHPPRMESRERSRDQSHELTLAELRAELRSLGLPLSGTRSDLLVRLRLAQASARIGNPHSDDTRTLSELRAELRVRGLPVSGRKAQLRHRLAFADGLLPWQQQQRQLATVLISTMETPQSGEASVKSAFSVEFWPTKAAAARLAFTIGVSLNKAMDNNMASRALPSAYYLYDI